MVKVIAPKYQSSDGQEFFTEEEAHRHEVLITLKSKYLDARHDYMQALASLQTTADGSLFNFSMLTTYYYITPGYYGKPEIADVSFYLWNCDLNDSDEAVIVQVEERNGSKVRVEYRISNLYRSRKIALKKLAEERKAWLKMLVEELESETNG